MFVDLLVLGLAVWAPALSSTGSGPRPDEGEGLGAVVQSLTKAQAVDAAFRIDRGANQLPILVPRDETLNFDVHLDLGILGSPRVGKVTIKTRVEPIEASPLLVGDGAGQSLGERVLFEAVAKGAYKLYEIEDTTSTVILPQAWPAIVHRKVQTGSENRRRELLIGLQDGVPIGEYRNDSHCKGCRSRSHYLKPAWPWQSEKHCAKCKRGEHRVWKKSKRQEVPAEAIDMLSSIQLARTMVAEGEDRLSFTMLDKLEVWEVDLRRGQSVRQEVKAGTYDAVEVRLSTRAPVGSEREEDFEGLFGIQGSISMWFDQLSGAPVLITGRVPAGPLNLNVRVELASVR